MVQVLTHAVTDWQGSQREFCVLLICDKAADYRKLSNCQLKTGCREDGLCSGPFAGDDARA